MDRLIDSPSGIRPDIARIPRLLLQNRWRIFWITIITMLTVAVINFLTPNSYISYGSLLPSGNQGSGGALGSLAGAISGVELLNTDPDPTASSQLFPEMLKSDVIRHRLLKTALPAKFKDKTRASTVQEVFSSNLATATRILAAATSIRKEKTTGVIYVGFEWTDPEFAQFVAAEYIRQLDSFCSNERFARLDENREFVQSRLTETESRLTNAEDSLLFFREQNRNYLNNSSPELQLEHDRLVRKVSEIGAVYAMLSQQLEMATIDAKRKKPVVAVLDYPTVPMEKSGPRRLTNILQFTLAALILSCSTILAIDYLRNYLSADDLRDISTARNNLNSRLSSVKNRITLRRKVEA